MSLQIRYNSATEVADVVTVRQGDVIFSSAAEEGSVAMSQLVVDDPDLTLNYIGLRRLYAYETAAQAHNQMVYNGYLQHRSIGRQPAEGPDDDEEVMGRRWILNIADTNSLLSRRLITGADGDRPAETDIARIQWLLDSNDAYLSNPQDTWENPSPYINTTGPVDMSAADLRGQSAFDVLNDCSQRSGKNWFAVYYEANDSVPPTNNGSIALWYDFDYSTAYSSTLRLTNVRVDADNVTTFAILPDGIKDIDPTRTYSGVLINGQWYHQSTTVANLFQQRDAAVSNPNVKTAAEAAALAARYLADAASEDERITCRYVCDRQYVNDLREGQRFEAKLSHLPGLSSYTWLRCLRRTVKHRTDDTYEITVTASGVSNPSIVQTVSGTTGDAIGAAVSFPAPVTAGNLLICAAARRNGGTGAITTDLADIRLVNPVGPIRAFAVLGSPTYAIIRSGDIAGADPAAIGYRVATGDEQNLYWVHTRGQFTFYELAGATVTGATLTALSSQGAAVTKSLGSLVAAGTVKIAVFLWDTGDPGTTPTQTVGSGWTQRQQVKDSSGHPGSLQMDTRANPTPQISGTAYEWGGIVATFPVG